MEAVFSKEIQEGLRVARLATDRRKSRLRLQFGGQEHPVLRMGKTGFAIAAEDAPTLRGLVDLYDGTTHLFQCLIIKAHEDAGEMQYEFKRATPVAYAAPLDFEQRADAPVALISQDN